MPMDSYDFPHTNKYSCHLDVYHNELLNIEAISVEFCREYGLNNTAKDIVKLVHNLQKILDVVDYRTVANVSGRTIGYTDQTSSWVLVTLWRSNQTRSNQTMGDDQV